MKLSIITINRNNAEGLKRTLDSVMVQMCKEYEHIIIDGASTDDSVDIIREYADGNTSNIIHNTSHTVLWVSEKDNGIYEAMNKGIEIVSGKRVVNSFNRSERREDMNKGCEDSYVLMLNSGDYLVDEHVIERIMPELDGTDIVQGNVVVQKEGKDVIERGYGKSDLSFIDVMKGFFLHQASFCKRDLFERYGYFDESYRINGDTVFYAKCLAFGNATFKYVDMNIAYFDESGISADPTGKWTAIRAEEDKRYMDMFSIRMQQLLRSEEQKIKLYDRLHAYKWSRIVTMAIAHLVHLLHKER